MRTVVMAATASSIRSKTERVSKGIELRLNWAMYVVICELTNYTQTVLQERGALQTCNQ